MDLWCELFVQLKLLLCKSTLKDPSCTICLSRFVQLLSHLTLWSRTWRCCHCSNTRDTNFLCSLFLLFSFCRLPFPGCFCLQRHLLFFSYFISSFFFSFFLSLPFKSSCSNLYASHAFTLHFPCWLVVSPLWRTLWKQCANIACLYPLGGIMAAITHWCSTQTDILLSLCWQTA